MAKRSTLVDMQNISKFNQFLNEIDLSYIKIEYLKHLDVEFENGDNLIMTNDNILTDITKVTIHLNSDNKDPIYWSNIHSARAIIDVQKVTEDVMKRYDKFVKLVYKRA